MLSYAFKRLAQSIPTLFIVITISFFLMRLAPGGPFDGERKLPPEIEANILAAYNLDKPLYWQFFDYLGGILQGDFGHRTSRACAAIDADVAIDDDVAIERMLKGRPFWREW